MYYVRKNKSLIWKKTELSKGKNGVKYKIRQNC